MTPVQRHALANHCRLAVETMHPKRRVQRGLYSLVVSVNSGYE